MSEAAVAREIAPIGVAAPVGGAGARHAYGPRAIPAFCNGAHQQTSSTSGVFEAKQDGLAVLCGCETSRGRRYCDGSHHQL
jgi:CDGSH-type Zn-finger protein